MSRAYASGLSRAAQNMLAIGNNVALADRLAIPSSSGQGRPSRSAGGWESRTMSVPKAPSGGTYSNHSYGSHAPMQHPFGGFGGGFGGFHPSFGPPSPYGMRPMNGMWPGHQYASTHASPSMNPLYATPTGQSQHQGGLYSTPTGTPRVLACPSSSVTCCVLRIL